MCQLSTLCSQEQAMNWGRRLNDLSTDWAEWSFVLCRASIVLIITLHRSFPLPPNVNFRDSDGASSNAFQQIWVCLSSQPRHLHTVLACSQLAPAPLRIDGSTWWRMWWRRLARRVNKQHCVNKPKASLRNTDPSFSLEVSQSWFVNLTIAQCVRKLQSCLLLKDLVCLLVSERHWEFFHLTFIYTGDAADTAHILRTTCQHLEITCPSLSYYISHHLNYSAFPALFEW